MKNEAEAKKKEAIAQAWKEYMKATEPAWEEWKRVRDLAIKAYQKAVRKKDE